MRRQVFHLRICLRSTSLHRRHMHHHRHFQRRRRRQAATKSAMGSTTRAAAMHTGTRAARRQRRSYNALSSEASLSLRRWMRQCTWLMRSSPIPPSLPPRRLRIAQHVPIKTDTEAMMRGREADSFTRMVRALRSSGAGTAVRRRSCNVPSGDASRSRRRCTRLWIWWMIC